MTRFDITSALGLHQVNSVGFVRRVLKAYADGQVVAILKESHPGFPLGREETPPPGGGWVDIRQDVIDEDRPAQVVFTSGTEGQPKAILLSHRALADPVRRLNQIMRVDASIREYVGVPVTYSFGLGRCRAVAAAGGQCFIPEQGFNPGELARMLASGAVNAVSAVPTLWRAVLSQPDLIGALGARVRWVEIGSQYMSRVEKEQMKALFPNAVIVQHYGLTEASRTTFLDISATEGEALESVGRATGAVEVRISDEGRIMIRGPHLATGQIVGSELRPLADAEGWYTTGDFGRLRDGYLYYEGRADDLINCAGVKIDPERLQEELNHRLHAEGRIAVCRIPDPLRGDGVFVAVERGCDVDLSHLRLAANEALLALGVNALSSIRVQEVAAIPRTDTGKVRRKDLSALYEGDREEAGRVSEAARGDTVRDLFASMFRGTDVTPEHTFRTLGGDSLNYVQMMMALEKRFGVAPENWDTMPIASLEAINRPATSTWYTWLDTTVFLRVLAITGVVLTHSGREALGGGTLLLFALIGYNMARFKTADFVQGRGWPWLRKYALAILVAYYLVAALYFGWNKSFEIDQLLLYANLVSARITVVFPFWFVQVLLQCLLLVGLLFSVPAFRRVASTARLPFSLVILAGLIAIRGLYPFFWDTDHLNDLVPTRFMAILWLGWCLHVVETVPQRLLMCAIGVGFAILDRGFQPVTLWLTLGSIGLALVPRVPVPAFAKQVFNDVGAATFYIFVLNGIIISLVGRIDGLDSSPVLFAAAMTGSMAFWWFMERSGLVERALRLLNVRV